MLKKAYNTQREHWI